MRTHNGTGGAAAGGGVDPRREVTVVGVPSGMLPAVAVTVLRAAAPLPVGGSLEVAG